MESVSTVPSMPKSRYELARLSSLTLLASILQGQVSTVLYCALRQIAERLASSQSTSACGQLRRDQVIMERATQQACV